MHVLHDTGLVQQGQGKYTVKRLVQEGGLTYQASVSVDGYPDQSYLRVDVWVPAGWTQVVRFNGYEVAQFERYDAGLPSPYAKGDKAAQVDELIDIALKLATRVAGS